MSDILALDSDDFAMLTLLDLSAAFDTVDRYNYILLKRLNISYGISHSVLGWLTSYLSDRTQFVQLNGFCSQSSVVTCGVRQVQSSDQTSCCVDGLESVQELCRMADCYRYMSCQWLIWRRHHLELN